VSPEAPARDYDALARACQRLDGQRPARAAGFVDAVHAMVKRQELPPAAADNATHHWTMYELGLVREAPELAAALYCPQPYDFRGEQPEGGKGWYELPVFTRHAGRLFVRYIRPYILASQRHADAPRIAPDAEAAMRRVDAMTLDPDYNVVMDFQPGDMQFVNNYHVLHARKAYVDDPARGLVRHLKRLWLETGALADRPAYFRRNPSSHWDRERTVSRVAAH